MNYYEAREIEKNYDGTGLFHFTKMNDGQIWPVGYCAQNCAGHPTKEEADEHYHEYRLDHLLHLDGNDPSTKRQCEICGEWTTGYARLDQVQIFNLCDDHLTRESVASLTSPSSSIVASW